MLAKASAHSTSVLPDPPLSRASHAPTVVWGEPNIRSIPPIPVGVSLLAKASAQSTSLLPETPPSRAGSLLQWGCGEATHPDAIPNPCGSGLAREGVGPIQHLCRLTHRHREQAHSYNGAAVRPHIPMRSPIPVGAGLLANASAHSTSLSPDTTPSLAGKLPQWSGVNRIPDPHHDPCRSEPAREGVSPVDIPLA